MEGIFQLNTKYGMVDFYGVPRHILDVVVFDCPVLIMGQNADGSYSVIPIMPINAGGGESLRVSSEILNRIAKSVEEHLKINYPPALNAMPVLAKNEREVGMTSMLWHENYDSTTGEHEGSGAVENGKIVTPPSGKTAEATRVKIEKAKTRRAEQLEKIKSLPSDSSISEIARQLNVSRSTVRSLLRGQNENSR